MKIRKNTFGTMEVLGDIALVGDLAYIDSDMMTSETVTADWGLDSELCGG